jgi:hypothetical protein
MALLTGWAEAISTGPIAAPMATVLMTSAAAMATNVRVNCDDISNLPFSNPLLVGRGPMHITNQGACQSRRTAEN